MEILNLGKKPENVIEQELLCESLADGSMVKFNRVTTINPVTGAIVSVANFNQDGTAYTVVDETAVNVCAPPQTVEKTIGRERLSVTDAAASSLTVPAGADVAVFSVVSGCGYVSDDGTAVLADGSIGHAFAAGGSAKVCGEDMADFSAIAATGEAMEVEVTYKQCVEK